MVVGMFITAVAFCIAGGVQIANDRSPVSVAAQIPQFAVLTIGEVLVSISGLEVAYSQAPKSMKRFVHFFTFFIDLRQCSHGYLFVDQRSW